MSDPTVSPPASLLSLLTELPAQVLAAVPKWYMAGLGCLVLTGGLVWGWEHYLPDYAPSRVLSLFERKQPERLMMTDPNVLAKLDALAKRQADIELQVRAAKGTIDKDMTALSATVMGIGGVVEEHTKRLDKLHKAAADRPVPKPKASVPPDGGPVAKISP